VFLRRNIWKANCPVSLQSWRNDWDFKETSLAILLSYVLLTIKTLYKTRQFLFQHSQRIHLPKNCSFKRSTTGISQGKLFHMEIREGKGSPPCLHLLCYLNGSVREQQNICHAYALWSNQNDNIINPSFAGLILMSTGRTWKENQWTHLNLLNRTSIRF